MKRAKKMLKHALTQLEMEVGKRAVLEGKVRELEERGERERRERERGAVVGSTLKGVLDEQRRRMVGEEVEVLRLKLSNTEKEL